MDADKTIEALRAWGADVDGALTRCLNKPDFYMKLLGIFTQSQEPEQLRAAIAAGNKEDGFMAAHSLKGVAGNLGLTPLYDACCAIVEPLRSKEDADYDALYAEVERTFREAVEAIDA